MVPESLVFEIENVLMSQLNDVVDAEDESTASTLARHLRHSVIPLLTPPTRWP
jgi:hypothetical protein